MSRESYEATVRSMGEKIAKPAPAEEEVVAAVPAISRSGGPRHFRDKDWAIELAARIAKLPNSHTAILKRRRLTSGETMVVRYELQVLGFHLICRTAPGETYFWRGERYESPTPPTMDGLPAIRTKMSRAGGRAK